MPAWLRLLPAWAAAADRPVSTIIQGFFILGEAVTGFEILVLLVSTKK